MQDRIFSLDLIYSPCMILYFKNLSDESLSMASYV
jgi:hypothetical protein